MPAKRGPLIGAKMPWDAGNGSPGASPAARRQQQPAAAASSSSSPSTRKAAAASTAASPTRTTAAAAPAAPAASSTRTAARKPAAPAAAHAAPRRREPVEVPPAAEPEPEPEEDAPAPTPPGGALYHGDDFGSEHPPEELELVRCNVCGRSFAADRIAKHQKACSKTGKKSRPVYNATAARLESDALKAYQQGEARVVNEPKKKKKPSKWRREHEMFVANLRAAKVAPGEAPPMVPSEPDPSLVQCPHCGRKFNEEAAKRHIPICTTLKTKPVAGSKAAAAASSPSRSPAVGGRGGSLAPAATMPALSPQKASPKPAAGRSRMSEPSREQCPHCGRQFEHSAFLRHVDICQKVQNKPKRR